VFGPEIHPAVRDGLEPIKLDPTIDRVKLRQQRDRLRELGYHFDFKHQQWMKS